MAKSIKNYKKKKGGKTRKGRGIRFRRHRRSSKKQKGGNAAFPKSVCGDCSDFSSNMNKRVFDARQPVWRPVEV